MRQWFSPCFSLFNAGLGTPLKYTLTGIDASISLPQKIESIQRDFIATLFVIGSNATRAIVVVVLGMQAVDGSQYQQTVNAATVDAIAMRDSLAR
jgi:hypothetical protein